jgi:hypothetical protein
VSQLHNLQATPAGVRISAMALRSSQWQPFAVSLRHRTAYAHAPFRGSWGEDAAEYPTHYFAPLLRR